MNANVTLLENCQICGSNELIGLQVKEAVKDRFASVIGTEGYIGWQMCCNCSFVFQNPRGSVSSQEGFYEESGYRKGGEEPIVTQSHLDFAPHHLARFHHWLLMNGVNMAEVENKNCLDYGCGIGGSLSFFAEKGNKNFGVEIDKQLAEFGNKTFPISIVPRVADLPNDIKFKLIFSNHALEHVFDPNELAEFASNRLEDDGVIMVAVPTWRYCTNLNGLTWYTTTENSLFDHVSLASLFNKHGLYMTSFLYQNYGEGGDWELFATAVKSARKNYYGFSVEEVLKEINVNIKTREGELSLDSNKDSSHLAVKHQNIQF